MSMRIKFGTLISLQMYEYFTAQRYYVSNRRFRTLPELERGLAAIGRANHSIVDINESLNRLWP
jgi:hypothetical protein